MPFAVTAFQTTPNPDAVKCLLDRRVTERPRSFFSAAEAAEDPLAAGIFAIEGVTNVLMNADWITVNKRPGLPWPPIKRAVQRVLGEAP